MARCFVPLPLAEAPSNLRGVDDEADENLNFWDKWPRHDDPPRLLSLGGGCYSVGDPEIYKVHKPHFRGINYRLIRTMCRRDDCEAINLPEARSPSRAYLQPAGLY